jgi:hypothetical protein
VGKNMSGYNLTKIGLIFLIIGAIIVTLVGVIGFLIEWSFMALIGIGIIAFLGWIMLLVGIILIGVDAIVLKEYGEKHRKFAIIAVILFIVGIVFSIIVSLVSSINTGSYGLSSSIDIDITPLKNSFLLSPFAVIFTGLVYMFLLHELEDKKGKIVLYVAFIVLIVTSIITSYLGYTGFDNWAPAIEELIENADSLESISTITSEMQKELGHTGIFGIIPNIIFLIAMILPLHRITTGNLLPAVKPSSTESGEVTKNYSIDDYKETYMAKRCPKCGTSNKSDSKFCENCGEILT